MTRDEFSNRLDVLLNDYCIGNPDYQNISATRDIVQINTFNVKQGVRVAIDTYLYRKKR